jgi:predicted DNA-binding transcriptional regulator AlpA
MTTDMLLTERQCSDHLNVPAPTLTRWRHRRIGPPFIKLGARQVRYRLSEVEAWLAAHAVATDGAER